MPFKFVEHPVDLQLNISGRTWEELFSDGLRGVMSAMRPMPRYDVIEQKHELIIEAVDAATLLVLFLKKALSLAELHKETFRAVLFQELSEKNIKATLTAIPVESFGETIKTVVYEKAIIKRNQKGEWEVILTLEG